VFGDIQSAANAISDIKNKGADIGKSFQNFYDSVAGGIFVLGSTLNAVQNGQGLMNLIKESLRNIAQTDLVIVGEEIAYGVGNGMTDVNSSGYLIFKSNQLVNMIIEFLKAAAGSRSPARKMIPIGRNITEGVVKGMIDSVDLIKNPAESIVESITSVLSDGISEAQDLATQLAQSVQDGFDKVNPVLDLSNAIKQPDLSSGILTSSPALVPVVPTGGSGSPVINVSVNAGVIADETSKRVLGETISDVIVSRLKRNFGA
jgi:hypothetical protein